MMSCDCASLVGQRRELSQFHIGLPHADCILSDDFLHYRRLAGKIGIGMSKWKILNGIEEYQGKSLAEDAPKDKRNLLFLQTISGNYCSLMDAKSATAIFLCCDRSAHR
jgi:hypothetical protein